MLARNEKADVHYYQVGFGLQIKWAKKESFNSQIHNQSINNEKKMSTRRMKYYRN